MAAGDRPSARDSPMASTTYLIFIIIYSYTHHRPRSNALKSSGITSSTLAFTHHHMALTHSDVADASGLPLIDGGNFDEYATGVDGVPSFRALQLLSI